MSENLSETFFADLPPRHAATLSTALGLFVSKGFFNTSIHDITDQAGVSIGFVYNNFGDKEGVARALYQQLLDFMTQQINLIEDRCSDAESRCRGVAKLLFELTESAPQVMDFIIHARHKEFLPNEPAICSSTPFARMRDFVYQGVTSGEIRAMQPLSAAMIAYGGVIRMICLRLDGVIEEPIHTYFEELWCNTWYALNPGETDQNDSPSPIQAP